MNAGDESVRGFLRGRLACHLLRRGACKNKYPLLVKKVTVISKPLNLEFQGAVSLDIGRLATGYGMGAFSYVVRLSISKASFICYI